jgi:hypothetical protein
LGGRLFTLVPRVDRLFELQDKVDQSVDIIEERLRAIEDRLLRMEVKGLRLLTEARAAAGTAATAMSGAALNDVVTRLTRVEMQLEAPDLNREPNAGGASRRRPTARQKTKHPRRPIGVMDWSTDFVTTTDTTSRARADAQPILVAIFCTTAKGR